MCKKLVLSYVSTEAEMFAPENELVPENGLKMISQTERGAFNHLTANVPPKMGLFKLLKEK